MGKVRVYPYVSYVRLCRFTMYTHNIGGVVIPFATGVNQDVELAIQRLGVVNVVQCSGGRASGDDGVVCNLLSTVGDAALAESGLKLRLSLCRLDASHSSFVSKAGDVVGLADHGNLVFILDDAASLDSSLAVESKLQACGCCWKTLHVT